MAKFQSPLLGYNNNVRHKNRIFHIQTEDSGINHPHIITHLFMDGGRILKSVKKSYAEHVGADGMSEIVRGMMKEQHKAMFIALRDGQFDHLVDGGAPAPASPRAAPSPTTTTMAAARAAAAKVAARPSAALTKPSIDVARAHVGAQAIEAARSSDVAAPSSRGADTAPATTPDPPREKSRPDAAPVVATTGRSARLVLADSQPDDIPATARQPQAPASAQELTLDFDALERATQDSFTSASRFQTQELPPPPKNLFAKEPGTGTYRAVEQDARSPQSGAQAAARSPSSSARGAVRPSDSRYAPARPAAIFGSTQKPAPQSIFGDELISDKSLDEVILSYLAEDLEPPRRK